MLHFRFDDNGAEQTVLLLHGFMGQMSDWHALTWRLKGKFNFLLIDLPGHGASIYHAGNEAGFFTQERVFAEINSILAQLKLPGVDVLGYSMGGRMALRWALQFPHRVRRLILESANPGISDMAERKKREQADRALSERLLQEDYRQFLLDWYALPLFGNLKNHTNFNFLLKRRLQNDPRQLAHALTGFSVGRQPALWDQLSGVHQPTLLVCGALDEKYRHITAEMQKRNPAFRRLVAEGCGHNVHFENPDWFAAATEQFLTEKGV